MGIELVEHREKRLKSGFDGVMIDKKHAVGVVVGKRHAVPVDHHVFLSFKHDHTAGPGIRFVNDGPGDVSLAHLGALPLHHLAVFGIFVEDIDLLFLCRLGDGVAKEPGGTAGGAQGIDHEDLDFGWVPVRVLNR